MEKRDNNFCFSRKKSFLHSKPQYTYNTHKTTHIKLYIRNIAYITATYKISEH